jgi:hypothetical protein
MRNRSNKFCPASCHDFVTRQALRKSFIFADYSDRCGSGAACFLVSPSRDDPAMGSHEVPCAGLLRQPGEDFQNRLKVERFFYNNVQFDYGTRTGQNPSIYHLPTTPTSCLSVGL